MARKSKKRRKKVESHSPILRIFVTILLVGFLSFVLLRRAVSIIEDAKVFEVKIIESMTETRIDYTKKLSYLLGKSIFDVNLKAAQSKLQNAYPQAAQIRVFRQLPNKIVIDFIILISSMFFDTVSVSIIFFLCLVTL